MTLAVSLAYMLYYVVEVCFFDAQFFKSFKMKWCWVLSKAPLIRQLLKESAWTARTLADFDSWVGKILWRRYRPPTPVFLGFPCCSSGKESAHNVGDLSLIPGLARCPGEGKGYSLQYSGLGNSMDCIVHGVTESDKTDRLSLSLCQVHFLHRLIWSWFLFFILSVLCSTYWFAYVEPPLKHKLKSRLPEEISITSDMQMTPPLWQKVKKN